MSENDDYVCDLNEVEEVDEEYRYDPNDLEEMEYVKGLEEKDRFYFDPDMFNRGDLDDLDEYPDYSN